MSNTMTRREWMASAGLAAGGTVLAGYGGVARAATAVTPKSGSPIRMMYNENPYAPSQVARRAMRNAFDEANLYAMREAAGELKQLIAGQVGLKPENILIGAGSTEILNVAGLAYGMGGGEIVSPHPTFEVMNRYGKTVGANVIRVPLRDDYEMDLGAMRGAVTEKTTLIYVCNPNNPTGTIIPDRELRPFCREMSEKALVFIDEAYHEYVSHPAYSSLVELVKEGKNVIVSRTASKVHGLAGLRVGFGFARPDIVENLQPKMTGTLNMIGLRAALASYRDQRFQQYSREKNEEAKQIVMDALDRMGREYARSDTNFIFFHTGVPISQFQAAMEARGIRVGRPFPPYLDWCRLSMARPREMELFAEKVTEVL